jgi:hypothetical protein
MGLDQCVFVVKKSVNPKKFEVEPPEDLWENPFHYWRKHPNLEGWMENLYRKKGGEEEDFNCISLLLTEEDLIQLGKDLLDKNLPETEGFFFGESTQENYYDTLEFVVKGLREINRGEHDLYYRSSW